MSEAFAKVREGRDSQWPIVASVIWAVLRRVLRVGGRGHSHGGAGS
jgi:hypothetical protein